MKKVLNVGVVGCGDISNIYMKNIRDMFHNVQLVACASRTRASAERAAAEYQVARVLSVEELLADPEVDIVLNLTTPDAHYDICRRALLSGKHVYTEKPLCIEMKDAQELTVIAAEQGLMIGCAPDTFLGGGVQTCRKLLDSGVIGKPLSAMASIAWHGPEHVHPNPAFLYRYGAGPIFDYGPYYFSALICMLGSAKSVCAFSSTGFETRTCTCPGPHCGETFSVETPTHYTGSIEFENDVLATVVASFDVWGHSMPFMEIYGTKGTIRMHDPDKFSGTISLLNKGESKFTEILVTCPYTENSRGLGLSNMADAILNQGTPICSGELQKHALEIMRAFIESAEKHVFVALQTHCDRPATLDK